jgi:hypothetical protein
MADYARTGIYIDPNAATKIKPPKKRAKGEVDIKHALRDMEAVNDMDMDDFMTGIVPAKRQRYTEDDHIDPVEHEVTEKEIRNSKLSMSQQAAKLAKKFQKDENGMPTF